MSVFVYILQCSDGSFYTGSTGNLERRIFEHQTGKGANYTKSRLPVRVVFQTEQPDRLSAIKLEKQIKGWSRKKKIALIERKFEDLPGLSECKNESHYKHF